MHVNAVERGNGAMIGQAEVHPLDRDGAPRDVPWGSSRAWLALWASHVPILQHIVLAYTSDLRLLALSVW